MSKKRAALAAALDEILDKMRLNITRQEMLLEQMEADLESREGPPEAPQ